MANKLPLGIQSFEKLMSDSFLYVDKTRYVYQLAHDNVPYFLSRPRRFGKSLLISTLKAYWEGQKELFEGLEIERLEEDNEEAWASYPVFLFDFNGASYQQRGALESALDVQLKRWEQQWQSETAATSTLSERFQNLLLKARETTGLRCVVLIDEYDKPLLDVVEDVALREHNKEVFKGFFSTLKSFDEHLQFVFITGVTKFHKVSIFSDLNQLRDISMSEQFSGVCGITESEIEAYFPQEAADLATKQGMSHAECLDALRKQYDGYRFHPNGIKVYNPYSLMGSLLDGDFGAYWFETGTPTFLVRQLRESRFDVRKFTNQTLFASEATLRDYTGDTLDPIPLLYQTGYLTIESFDRRRRRYTLCFPNEEVKYGFLESMIPAYLPEAKAGNGLDIFTLDEYVENGNLEGIRDVLTALFAGITYTLEDDPFEHYFQAVIYLVFTLLGKFVQCEMHTYTGRVDCKVETQDFVYLFEFKRDDTAEEALAQIDEREYALPFVADSRRLFKIGVSFDSVTRKLVGWKATE